MVGKKEFQGLTEEEDAHHPDSSGEDGCAEKCPGLWGPVGATSVREEERAAGVHLREILTGVLMAPKEQDLPSHTHIHLRASCENLDVGLR